MDRAKLSIDFFILNHDRSDVSSGPTRIQEELQVWKEDRKNRGTLLNPSHLPGRDVRFSEDRLPRWQEYLGALVHPSEGKWEHQWLENVLTLRGVQASARQILGH